MYLTEPHCGRIYKQNGHYRQGAGAVKNVTATAVADTADTIELRWIAPDSFGIDPKGAPDHFRSYMVLYSEGVSYDPSSATRVKDSTNTHIIVDELKANTAYSFVVASINTSGKMGQLSAPVSRKTNAINDLSSSNQASDPPTELVAKPKAGSASTTVTVRWAAPSSTGTSIPSGDKNPKKATIIKYKVEYSIGSSVSNTPSDVTTVETADAGTSIDISSLRAETKYTFRVKAINDATQGNNESDASSEYSITTVSAIVAVAAYTLDTSTMATGDLSIDNYGDSGGVSTISPRATRGTRNGKAIYTIGSGADIDTPNIEQEFIKTVVWVGNLTNASVHAESHIVRGLIPENSLTNTGYYNRSLDLGKGILRVNGAALHKYNTNGVSVGMFPTPRRNGWQILIFNLYSEAIPIAGTTGFDFTGEIGEVLLYRGTLALEEKRALEKTLGAKWGIPIASYPPMNVKGTLQGGTTVNLTWNAPQGFGYTDTGKAATLKEYIIQSRHRSITEEVKKLDPNDIVSEWAEVGRVPSDTRYTISKLRPWFIYEFQVIASTQAVYGSEPLKVLNSEASVPSTGVETRYEGSNVIALTAKASGVPGGEVTISWGVVGAAPGSGFVIEYAQVDSGNTMPSPPLTQAVLSTARKVGLTELIAGKRYIYRIKIGTRDDAYTTEIQDFTVN